MNKTRAYARRNDPATSWETADQVTEKMIASSQTAVLYLLRTGGPQTVDQLHRQVVRAGAAWTKERTRTACTELAREGTVKVFSTEGRSDYGKPCQIWAAVAVQEELLTRQEVA